MTPFARKLFWAGVACLSFTICGPAFAVPTLAEIFESTGITEKGYLDVSYNYLNTDGAFVSGVPSRVFDSQPSAFTLNQLALTLARQPEQGLGGLVNVTLGRDADVIAAAGTGNNDNFDLTQAYLQYAVGGLTVIGGKYVTLSGAEVIDSTAVPNLSRSILFGYAIPFSHTGARASYKLSDAVTLIAGVNNGWDELSDPNSQKTIEVGALLAPLSSLSLSLAGYSGSEPNADGSNGVRSLIDAVATWQATEALALVLNYDYGVQNHALGPTDSARWSGVAAYANYKLNDAWRTSLRAEYFNDKDGFRTGVPQRWKEATLTLAYAPLKWVDLLGEVRYDKSDKDAFADDAGVQDNQASVGVKALLKF